MMQPARCFDGILLVLPLNQDATVIKKEGTTYSNEKVYLINESDLYEINTHDALLFFLPSRLFKAIDINIFSADFAIREHDVLRADLFLLFKYYQAGEQDESPAQNLIVHILKGFKHLTHTTSSHSIDYMLHQMINYIRNHLQERITLDVLSKKFNVSPSYISTLFKQNLNINFYDYTASLKIAKSLELLSIDDTKIKTIAAFWHYPSPTNYIINFKKYMGITPKKYKSLSLDEYELDVPNITSDMSTLKRLYLNSANDTHQTTIFIDDTSIDQPPLTFFNLVDIGFYHNIDRMIHTPTFYYNDFMNYKTTSYIYINEPIEHIITDNMQKIILKLRKLFQMKLSIAIKLNDIQSYHYVVKAIEDLHFLESAHLPAAPFYDSKLLLLLDSKHFNVNDIKRIKRNIYGIRIAIALDVTDYFLEGHSIDETVYELNPDYFVLDYQKVKTHYQATTQQTYSELQTSLYRFLKTQIKKDKAIFLNYDVFYTPDVLSNTGLFLKKLLSVQPYLAGATIGLIQSPTQKHHVALFDSIENKTTIYFLGIMMLNFSVYPCYYGENYILTRTKYSYNLLLYNAQSIEQVFYITLPDKHTTSKTLVSTEILNSDHGDADSMICARVRDKHHFPNSLRYKLSQCNTPHLNVDEHDFNDGAYVTHLPKKSVAMITLYTS
ncbi:helix-turn-helix transcriptional regulator [Staphylococcus americanisciuri]|uniref:Helix-turn-helix domain-containing protein n=1 Tax=Staphylococcus americanisciuri TaxID=2973940 RepID=A0ABT2F3W0_9STAP|nr:helix-turn-helix transcriptional regulator [Staphylococcus americanisciuri]MCS4487072.1 helix-turn-helix domain-containing protein [Staphylococcus americanisciuri]